MLAAPTLLKEMCLCPGYTRPSQMFGHGCSCRRWHCLVRSRRHVPKQKVCDEEKLLQIKCSQDPSCPSLRMPHGCWCCSRLHHGIAPACPSLQGASCPASASLGTSQPAESICRVQTADSSAWGGPQGSQWVSQVQRGGTVLGQRLDPCVQAETLCNGAGEVKNNFSSFCLRTDCLHLYKSSYVYSAVAWCSSSAHEKLK